MYRKVKAQQESNVSFKHRLILIWNGHALHILQQHKGRVTITILSSLSSAGWEKWTDLTWSWIKLSCISTGIYLVF